MNENRSRNISLVIKLLGKLNIFVFDLSKVCWRMLVGVADKVIFIVAWVTAANHINGEWLWLRSNGRRMNSLGETRGEWKWRNF